MSLCEECVVCGLNSKSHCGKCKVTKYCSGGCQRVHWEFHKKLCGSMMQPVWGKVGLANLGNTCYLNAGIQSLLAIKRLCRYFISDEFVKEVNVKNPLGKEGKLAISFSQLLKSLFFGSDSHLSPIKFKSEFIALAPQYAGYAQHDAHELLSYIIDILGEEVNIVESKRNIEINDIVNESDESLAERYRISHAARIQSKIHNLFIGQEKSSIHCPKCDVPRKSFPMFTSISLPIPRESRCISLLYFDFDDVIETSVVVSAAASIIQLKQSVKKKLVTFGKDSDVEMAVTVVKDNRFFKVLADAKEVDSIKSSDFACVYRVTCGNMYERKVKKINQIRVLFRDSRSLIICHPLIIDMNDGVSCDEVYQKVHMLIKKHVKHVNADMISLYRVKKEGNECSSSTCLLIGCKGCLLPNNTAEALLCDRQYLACEVDKLEPFSYSAPKLEILPLKSSLNLYDLFESFSAAELLDINDSWYCNICKEHLRVSKKLELYILPEILVLQLKRFKFNSLGGCKVDDFIDFPMDLDMNAFVVGPSGNYLYELISVIDHEGSVGAGHYTATRKCWITGKWYYCNDSLLREVEFPKVSKCAYVLIYQKKK